MTETAILIAAKNAALDWGEPSKPESIYENRGWLVRFPAKNPPALVVVCVENQKVYRVERKIATRYLELLEAVGCDPRPGLPISPSFKLASLLGDYQEFERGVIYAYNKLGGEAPVYYAENIRTAFDHWASIAVFDLRDFSKWASNAQPDEVQNMLKDLEKLIQQNLKFQKCELFLKGTGDGVLAILLFDRNITQEEISEISSNLLHACARIIHSDTTIPLPIGCAVTFGAIKRVRIYGQWDCIGTEINSVSKLQHQARNSIIVTPVFKKLLPQRFDIVMHLEGNNFKCSPKELLAESLR